MNPQDFLNRLTQSEKNNFINAINLIEKGKNAGEYLEMECFAFLLSRMSRKEAEAVLNAYLPR